MSEERRGAKEPRRKTRREKSEGERAPSGTSSGVAASARASISRIVDSARGAAHARIDETVRTLFFPEVWYLLDNWLTLAKATRVLEVGGGIGLVAEALARSGRAVSVVDPADAVLDHLRGNFERASLQGAFTRAELERLPFPAASFDAVVAVTTLEATVAPTIVVREIARVLAPGGLAVIASFNRLSPWAVPAVFRAVRKLHPETSDAPRFLAEAELKQLLTTHGLAVEAVKQRARYVPGSARVGKIALPVTGSHVVLARKGK